MGTAGLGIDFFVGPNVALEIKGGTLLFEGGDFNYDRTNSNKAFLNVGFKIFLYDRFSEPFNLRENYLKKGNIILSGTGNFAKYDNIRVGNYSNNVGEVEYKGYQIYAYPELEYFKTDNWLLKGRAGMSFVKSNENNRLSSLLQIGSKYFIPLNDRLFLVPSIDVNYNRSTTHATYTRYATVAGEEVFCIAPHIETGFIIDDVREKRTSHVFGGKADLALTYFTKANALINGGISFLQDVEYYKGAKRNDRSQINLFFGGEYYFAKNIALYGQLSYIFSDTQNHCSLFGLFGNKVHSGGLSFGVKYFIFNDKNQVD